MRVDQKKSRNKRGKVMKTHKIKNIDRSICTAEQKIAYNFAFSDYTHIERVQREYSQAVASETAYRLRDIHIEELKRQGTRYNLDAIFCAYNAGIWDYIKLKYHILTTYEEIGKIFPVLY